MRTTVELDEALAEELKDVALRMKKKPSAVIQQALRAGLPIVADRFQSRRPEGYFTSDYPLPKDRLELEAAMAKVKQRPER